MTMSMTDLSLSLLATGGFEGAATNEDGAVGASRTLDNGVRQGVAIDFLASDDIYLVYVITVVKRRFWFDKYRSFLLRASRDLSSAEVDRVTSDFDLQVIGYLDKWKTSL